jgi:hypothetical protein
MKRILLFVLVLFTLSTAATAQIRIEKRHYTKGWYIHLTTAKKKKQLPAATKPEPGLTAQNETQQTETKEILQDKLIPLQEAKPELQSVKIQQLEKTQPQTNAFQKIKSKAPVLVPKQLQNTGVVKSIAKKSSHEVKRMMRSASTYGDNDMWGLFLQLMLCVLLCIVVAAVLGAIVQAILYSLFPVATAELIVWIALIAFWILVGIGYGVVWLWKKISEWREDRRRAVK